MGEFSPRKKRKEKEEIVTGRKLTTKSALDVKL